MTRTQDERKISPLRMQRTSWRGIRTFDVVQGDAYVRRFRYWVGDGPFVSAALLCKWSPGRVEPA